MRWAFIIEDMSKSEQILKSISQLTGSVAGSALLITTILAASAYAQRTQPPPPPKPTDITADKGSMDDAAPLTTFEEELRAKRAIKLAEKEHEENLGRAREISQVAHELREAAKSKATFDRNDVKKLDRIEKLARKIRGEAGGEDDQIKIERPPADVPSTVQQIGDTAESLSKNVQNTPRQVISAAVIDTANVLLELIRLARSLVR